MRGRVLYLPSPDPSMPPVFDEAIEREVGGRHDLRTFDHDADLKPQFADIDVVIDLGGSVGTREMLHAATSVKLWQVLGMGLDHFDLEYWESRGMPVAHCPGPLSAVALGECALMYMLMLARRYPQARANADAQQWYSPVGSELEGRSLALIGFGSSARELAARAKAFGMRILAIDALSISADDTERFGVAFAGTPDDIDEMLPQADFVSVHLPLNAETRHILDARRLALLRPSAHVINVARGALVDEGALVEALRAGRLAGAGLDVFGTEPLPADSPLYSMENVVMTPHVAGVTDGTARRRAALAAENCDRIAKGLEPICRVV